MKEKFFIEIDCQQKQHYKERICGDVFVSEKIKEEGRIVLVLSDGMGHGVKANVLATLTATMAANFTHEHKEPEKTADIIMRTLPECSERKMNYSTFTIVDVEYDGKTKILEYDNPQAVVIRDKKELPLDRKKIVLDTEKNRGKEIYASSFYPKKGDRLIFCSDGITQSGLGSAQYPFGWTRKEMVKFVEEVISRESNISARQLASKILNRAFKNDGFSMRDDTSCVTVYYRNPRELLISTGPPYEEKNDSKLAQKVVSFGGKKIIMGATTSDIVARELNKTIEAEMVFEDPDLPPVTQMEGVDLITEGILTLNKVEQILKNYHSNYNLGNGPADKIVKLIRESDEINFIIGTRINIAHQDPSLPIELEIRRTIVKRIAGLLEKKLLKKIKIEYI